MTDLDRPVAVEPAREPLPAGSPPRPGSAARAVLPKLAISLMLGALFAWLVARGGVPLVPPPEAFGGVVWWTVPVYAATVVATNFVRASRWRFLVAPIRALSLREVVLLNWIGFFAIFALPMRLGEFARPALGKLRAQIPLSAGFGTVAVERVVDGLLSSLCVAWAVFALPHRATSDDLARHVPTYGMVALAAFCAALLALALFLWQRQLAAALVQRTLGLVSRKLAALVAAKIDSVADGVRSIAEPRLASLFALESLVYWGLNAAGMWLLGWGCGLPMGFGHAVAIMGILAIGILLPAGPGMFGNFQLATSAALKLYFAEELVASRGAVYVFLLYVVQGGVLSIAGIVPLYAMRIRFSELLAPPRA
jgi:uncharacterized membrane protein YbhN (UPF0104 family)